jgi:cell division protein FtsB
VSLLSRLSRFPRPSLTSILLGAIVLVQVPLWFGEGGWRHVWRLERQIEAKSLEAERQQQRILELQAEVDDLKRSPKAAEERARYELGLIQPGERFVQWVQPNAESTAPAPPPGPVR